MVPMMKKVQVNGTIKNSGDIYYTVKYSTYTYSYIKEYSHCASVHVCTRTQAHTGTRSTCTHACLPTSVAKCKIQESILDLFFSIFGRFFQNFELFDGKTVGVIVNKFVIYTDGASTIKNVVIGGVKCRLFYGGWAFVVIDSSNGRVVESNSGSGRFKTGQAELCAIGAAFDWLERNGHRGCPVKFKTDSMYAIDAMTELIHRDDSKMNCLANPHILKRLRYVVKRHGGRNLAQYNHVKGHSGNLHNELADELAVTAKMEFINTWHAQDLDAIESGQKSISKSKSC